jgi:PBP1b-binding outer membrane lipoprotein LpoB
MKHIIIILSSALLLTSCSKVPKCWECTRTVKITNTNIETVTSEKVCDKTKKEIDEYIKINSTRVDTSISIVTECH